MKCKTCGETKASEFYESIGTYCKAHWKIKVRRSRKKNSEHYKEYDKARADRPDRVKARRAYQKTEAGKQSLAKAKKKWLRRNILTRAAHVMLGNAVRDGRVIKGPCEVCGSTERIHGHHEDYAKPFDVRWLCPKHHAEAHKG